MAKLTDDPSPPIIVWLRRDLRVADNPALANAAAGGQPVIVLYILEDDPGGRPLGAASAWWLDRSLRALAARLQAMGSRLILRRGEGRVVIGQVVAETGANCLFWNRRYDPVSVERDRALMEELDATGVDVRSFNAGLLNEPWSVLTDAQRPYKVFTAYWRRARAAIEATPLHRAPTQPRAPAAWPRSDDIEAWRLAPHDPDWSSGFDWTPGEAGAQAQLDRFLDHGLAGYADGRDRPAEDGSSRLSPYLHWGEIGPRQILHRLRLAEHHGASHAQAEGFLRELGWREFNHQLLFHFPALARDNLRPEFDRMAWRSDGLALKAWKLGETGYPMVDAAMRQLWTTGWMHNRARMIAASFLVKDLLVDWREGEAWFWDTLVDADEANNAANWQWVAGSGADAQPFFRIFNPVTQGERFDPDGDYIRRWVPELADLPAKTIHAPWTADADTLRSAGVELGRTYPKPLVDHQTARARALEAYRIVRSQAAQAASS
jgi:deoxyribodipyrimidine photo-lyase